jgi:hypothetical protein
VKIRNQPSKEKKGERKYVAKYVEIYVDGHVTLLSRTVLPLVLIVFQVIFELPRLVSKNVLQNKVECKPSKDTLMSRTYFKALKIGNQRSPQHIVKRV